MSFHNVLFPVDISYGSAGGAGFDTEIIRTDNSAEQRISRRENALNKYNVAYNVKSPEKIASLIKFHRARRGSFYSFRYFDHLDHKTTSRGNDYGSIDPITPVDQLIDVSDGTTEAYQLVKRYDSGGFTNVRPITKPVDGTIRVAIAGVEAVSGWSVNDTTGILTFSTPPADGQEITWGGEFHVPVRFSEDDDKMLDIKHDDYGVLSTGMVLEEVLEDITTVQDTYKGGGTVLTVGSADWYDINEKMGRVIHIEEDTENFQPSHIYNIKLPEVTSFMPSGGPYFKISYDLDSDIDFIGVYDGAQLVVVIDETRPSCEIDLINNTNSYKWLIIKGSN